MAITRQVTCINKTHRSSPHERISHIGGVGWKMTSADAITGILNKNYHFFVSAGGYNTNVIVKYHLSNPYLATEADTTLKDNLLSLDECR